MCTLYSSSSSLNVIQSNPIISFHFTQTFNANTHPNHTKFLYLLSSSPFLSSSNHIKIRQLHHHSAHSFLPSFQPHSLSRLSQPHKSPLLLFGLKERKNSDTMFEESVSAIAPSSSSSSIWASMNSWFTPSVFFVLLNVMIGTIAFTSSLANNQNKPQLDDEPHHRPNKIARSTSILQRLKSINFYRSQEHHQNPSPQHNSTADSDTLFGVEAQPHYFFNQENLLQTHQSQDSYMLEQNLQETETQIVFEQKDSNLDGSEQAHERNAVENESRSMDEIYCILKGSNFMGNKSASSEQEIVAARMREWEESVRERGMADEGVDAKADDFINKFKHQLKLQRLDEASEGRR